MTVREIMSAPVLTVGLDATVSEIAEKLQENRVSGLIVVDEAGLMVGVVGEGDLLYQVASPSSFFQARAWESAPGCRPR